VLVRGAQTTERPGHMRGIGQCAHVVPLLVPHY